MRSHAMLKDGEVVRIESIEEASYQSLATQYEAVIDIEDINPKPQIGWVIVDGLLAPKPGQAPTEVKITKLALRNRMTTAELVAVHTAAKTNPVVEVLLTNLSVATFIDLKRPDTINGIYYLVSVGIITSQRAQEILSLTVAPHEAFNGDKT